MKIYIRKKPRWVNFVNPKELQQLIEDYTCNPIVIGDVSLFSSSATQRLLKFVEENPQVDLYASHDFECAPLFSRATQVIKEYTSPIQSLDLHAYAESPNRYNDIQECLESLPYSTKLQIKGAPQRFRTILTAKLQD